MPKNYLSQRPIPTTGALNQAINQYPILRKYNLQGVDSRGAGNGNMLEFWPPNEMGSPGYTRPPAIAPDALGVQVFNPNTTPKDIMADVTSHYLVHNDPNLKNLYTEFTASFTPQQQKRLQQDYQWAIKNEQETRPFAQWVQQTRIPAYFRGYTFNQWPDSFNNKVFTKQQKQILNKVRSYLNIQ